MLYLLKNLDKVQPNTLVVESFVAIDLVGTGVDIAIDNGLLKVNGVPSAQSANVEAGDLITIEVTSSSNPLATEFVVVRQEGIVQGILSVTTISDKLSQVVSDYFDLEPYEVLPSATWVPDTEIKYLKYNSLMLQYDEQNLTSPIGKSSLVRYIICDYHRDKVYLINTGTWEHFATLDTYAGPVDTADLFSNGIRFLNFIAYRKDNKLIGYESTAEVLNIDVTDPIKLQSSGNVLYVLEKNALAIKTFTVDPTTLDVVEATVNYAEPILDFIVTDQGIAVLHKTKIIDFDSSEFNVNAAYKFAYNDQSDRYVVTHRTSGAYTYTDSVMGSRITTYEESELEYLSIPVAYDSDFLILGEKGSLRLNSSNDSISNVNPPNPRFSLDESSGLLYGADLYPDIPSRVTSIDLEPDSVDLGEVDATPVGTVVTSNEVTISDVEQPVSVKLPDLPGFNLTLIKNGSPVVTPTTVENADTIQVEYTIPEEYASSFYLPIVISDRAFIFKVLPPPGQTLPRETSVSPRGVIIGENQTFFSNTLRMPLIEEAIYIEIDKGILFKNNIEVGTGANFNRGDRLSINFDAPVSGVEYVTLTFGNNAYQSVVAFNEQTWNPSEGESPTVIFNLTSLGPIGTNFDDRREGDWMVPTQETIKTSPARVSLSGAPTVDLEVPNIWNSKIYVNGIDSGRQVTVSHGDELEFEMTTTAVYDIQHMLPIIVPSIGQHYWNVYTIPDMFVDPFDLGLTDGHVITDYVISNEVTITGLGSRVEAPISTPFNTKLFINGVLQNTNGYDANVGGNIDYREVAIQEVPQTLTPTVRNGDTVRLEGYPRPVYGTLQTYELQVGYSKGYWRVGLINIDEDAGVVSSHFAEVTLPQIEAVATSRYEHVEVDLQLSPVASASSKSNKVNIVSTGKVYPHSGARVVDVESRAQNIAFVEPRIPDEPRLSLRPSGNIHETDEIRQSTIAGSNLIEVNGKDSLLLRSSILEANTLTGLISSEVSSHTFGNPEFEYYSYTSLDLGFNYTRFESRGYLVDRQVVEVSKYVKQRELDFVEAGYSDFIIYNNAYISIDNTAQKKEAGVFPTITPKSFIKDFVVRDAITDTNFIPQYEVIGRNVDPEMTPSWEKDYTSVSVEIIPIWEKDSVNPTVNADKNYIKQSRPVLGNFESNFKVIPRPIQVEAYKESIKSTSNSSISADRVIQFKHRPPTIVIGNSPSSEKAILNSEKSFVTGMEVHALPIARQFGSNGLISIGNTSESELQQVFVTELAAEQNAELVYGLSPGDYTVVPYEDKYVWIRLIPCENMCYTCPDTGYIQGG